MKLVFLEKFSDDLKKITDKKVKRSVKKLFSELNQLSHCLIFQDGRSLKVRKIPIACELVITELDFIWKKTLLFLQG